MSIKLSGVFILAALFACAENAARNNEHSSILLPDGNGVFVTFPHAEGWASPLAHGLASLAGDGTLAKERCNGCHLLDSDKTDGPPGCRKCHSMYPHPPRWGDSGFHVSALAPDSASLRPAINGLCATSCHGSDLKGGLSSVACTQCHSQYPHDSDWKNAWNHGAKVLNEYALGLPGCRNCHGVNSAQTDLSPTCASCHSGLPNPAASVQHKPSQDGACSSCHATNAGEVKASPLLRESPPLLCTQCHTSFSTAKAYQHSTTQTGEACLRCHRPHDSAQSHLLKAPESQLCFSCHNTELSSPQYGTTRNMQAAFTESSNLHPPFEQARCGTCHNSHGSPYNHLLTTQDSMFWIGGGVTVQNFSCFTCHDYGTYVTTAQYGRPNTITRPSTQLPTQFVLLKSTTVENLHWYHAATAGASCLSCHEPHANNDKYLLRGYLTYSDPGASAFWTRGNCYGCHTGQYPPGYPNNLW